MLPVIVTDIFLPVLLLLSLWLVYRQSVNLRDDDSLKRLLEKHEENVSTINALKERFNDSQLQQQEAYSRLREELQKIFSEQNSRFEQRQTDSLKNLLEAIQNGMTNMQKQVGEHLAPNSEDLGKRMEGLTPHTDKPLPEIS